MAAAPHTTDSHRTHSPLNLPESLSFSPLQAPPAGYQQVSWFPLLIHYTTRPPGDILLMWVGLKGKEEIQIEFRENKTVHFSQIMQPAYFAELMLTEFTEFRGKQAPELPRFLPAISKLSISLPLVTYRGEFISCLSTLVKPWNELNCYKKVKIRNAKSHLMQLIKSHHLCSFACASDFTCKLSFWSCVW